MASEGESVNILKEDLRRVVREVVREELRREMRRLFMELIPYVSDEEMKEIEEEFGSPEEWKDEEMKEIG